MRRAVLLIVGILIHTGPVWLHAQPTVREAIRAEAQAMNTNFVAGQYEKVIDKMYPKIVEAAGGREALIKEMKNGVAQVAQSGFKIESGDIGEVGEPAAAGGKLFAIVSSTTHVRGPNVMLEGPGFLLAISTDQGKTWSLLDGAGITPETLKRFFPDFPPALKLPEKQPPKVIPLS